MSKRLTAKTLAEWRAQTLALQGSVCALCKEPMSERDKAVGDHCHASGQMRGVLHRSCNALLGNIENNAKRYGIRSVAQLGTMLRNTVAYIHLRRPDDTPLYPTHRTEDEKRLKRNAAARKARAAMKAQA